MIITKAQKSDIDGILNVHFETGFFGNSMSKFLTRRTEWSKFLNSSITQGIIIVAKDRGKVVGYCGTAPTESDFTFTWAILSSTAKTFFGPSKDRTFWISQCKALVRIACGLSPELKLKSPDGIDFHINLLPKYRGKGFGTKLLKMLESRLSKGTIIIGKSYCSKLNDVSRFNKKNGVLEYSRVKTTLWRDQTNESVDLVCFSKKI